MESFATFSFIISNDELNYPFLNTTGVLEWISFVVVTTQRYIKVYLWSILLT